MKRIFTAVMHCTTKQIDKLIVLGNKVISGLSANAATFPLPNPAVALLTTEVSSLETLAGLAKGNTQKKQARDQQAAKVFGMLKTETNYVNGIAKGDRAVILLSGFDASNEPTPQHIPDAPVIKRIENGSSPHSAKILLAKTSSPLNTEKIRLTFIVQMTEDDSMEENWKIVLQTQNSKKLIFINLARGKEIFFRIAAMNAHGQSDWSETANFIPQ